MSGQPPRRREKGDNPSRNSGAGGTPSYFLPSSKIDDDVLRFYAKSFLDKTSTVDSVSQPKEPSEKGWRVYSRTPLNEQDIIALIEDTTQWRKEKKSGKGHTSYDRSETARKRSSLGRSQVQSDGKSVNQSQNMGREPPVPSQQPHRSQFSSGGFAASQRPMVSTASNASISQYGGQPSSSGTQVFSSYVDNRGGGPRPTSTSQRPLASGNEVAERLDGDSGNGGGGNSGGGGGGGQPTSTGTQGFTSLYSTAGGPPAAGRFSR